MNRAGLFGGGWEDYLDALNEAFDRHVAENMPSHPFGASVDAIMTGYPDDAPDSMMARAASAPVLETPVSYSVSPKSGPAFGMGSGGLGSRSGLQIPQDRQSISDYNSASLIPRGKAVAVPDIASTDQAPSVWRSKAMRDAAARAAGDQFSPPPGFREPVNDCATHKGADADACIDIDTDGTVKTWYNHTSYDHLDPVAKEGVDAHEKTHESQIEPYLHWWEPTVLSRWIKDKDFNSDRGNFEIPAYQAEIDVLQRHLDEHPAAPNYDAIQARIKDRQLRIDGYRKQRK